MPITNIIDRRRRRYRFNAVYAIVEPAWYKNGADADQAERPESDSFTYDERSNISVADAIQWANSFRSQVTLFLCDRIAP
jgi:hypothetical protein